MTVRIEAMSRPAPGNRAVVVFPHAGGSPRYYTPWRRHLPVGIDLFGVTYPGRDALLDEPAPNTLLDLAEECAAACRPIIGPSRAPTIFGHSMGSYVALETTRLLQQSGVAVAALVVSGAGPPQVPERVWHNASDEDLVRHLGELDLRTGEALAVPELRQMFLPAIRSDYRLVETYRAEPGPQLSCPIYVMYGASDPDVSESEAAEWSTYTRAGSQVRVFPGDHFYLGDQVAPVVAHLSAVVHSARSRTIRDRSMP